MRMVEYLSIALFAALASVGLWKLVDASGVWFFALALVAIPIGWIASDLLSGLVHLSFDTFGSVQTPVIGHALIRPFREHHADPEAMTRHDFVETYGASCLAALPLLAVVCFSSFNVLIESIVFFTAIGALATNQCHKWAHMEEAATPAFVRWLQRAKLVLPRAHHRRHHTPPFDSHFCMSCGWLNPAVDYCLKAFR